MSQLPALPAVAALAGGCVTATPPPILAYQCVSVMGWIAVIDRV